MINFGWDERGFARKTGIAEIDRLLGSGGLQDAQDCGYVPTLLLDSMNVDTRKRFLAPSPRADEQFRVGRIYLMSGAVLERGKNWVGVWACTRLPDSHREPCNGSCRCCDGDQQCEGQSTCPEHCPMSVDVARRLGMLAEHPCAASAA